MAARASTDDENIHRQVLNSVIEILPQFSLDIAPPQTSRHIYRKIAQVTGVRDPYHGAKQESNRRALQLYPQLKQIVASAHDPLFAACKLAIAGNAIDLGAQAAYEDVDTIIDKALALPFGVDHYGEFRASLEKTSRLLYLGDNAGEIVFDRVLIEEIRKTRELEVHFVVRGEPIINDVTWEDAEFVGMDKVAEVVSNGSDAPAMVLSECSPEVLELYHSADVIISKGQGNYEVLNEENANIFFFLKIKCDVVARMVGVRVGDAILRGRNVQVQPFA